MTHNTRKRLLIRTAEAAKLLKVTERWIRKLCEAGDFGTKVGRDWIIERDDLDRVMAARNSTAD